jgi:hypothetical protein
MSRDRDGYRVRGHAELASRLVHGRRPPTDGLVYVDHRAVYRRRTGGSVMAGPTVLVCEHETASDPRL